MDYIKINEVLYEYFIRDSEGNIDDIKRALDGVSLGVKKGQFISIIGGNGSGKSTLARLINALLIPAEGTVTVGGMDTKDSSLHLAIRSENTMVFQNPDNQIVSGVVEEDVAFGPENLGVESGEIEERVKECLERVGLSEKRYSAPGKLSGGQKQKLAIASVLAMKPQCIILDEATAMLDPADRKEVISTAHKLNKENGITIILITHNMEETIDSDYVYVLGSGKIQKAGTPREIFLDLEILEANHLFAPQIADIAYKLRRKGLHISEGITDWNVLLEELRRLKYGH